MLLDVMFQLRFFLIVHESDDLRDPTFPLAAAQNSRAAQDYPTRSTPRSTSKSRRGRKSNSSSGRVYPYARMLRQMESWLA